MAIEPNLWPLVQYTSDQRMGGAIKDPINLVYVGALADPDTVYDITVKLLGLRHDKGLSDQYFREPADPRIAHRQDFNQSNHFISGWWSRIHTRVYTVFTEDGDYGPLMAAPIHIDHWIGCDPIVNDAAESYDKARKWATSRLRQRYDVAVVPMRTFDPIPQCGGDATRTDGRCAIVARKNVLRAPYTVLTEDEP